MFESKMLVLFGTAILESLYMTLVSTAIAYLLGLPLGVLLYVTSPGGIRPAAAVNRVLGVVTNALRSAPFIILLVALIPVTRAIVGTTLGSTATIVPLVIGAAPFIARLVEASLAEVDGGVVEAAQSMGASNFQIVTRVLLREAKPSLITGGAIAVTTILAYSAMAGFVGGGGLGAVAINYGYYRYQTDVMLVTLLLLVVIVQVFQEIGMKIALAVDKRKR